jgi:uncharacterized protein with HEPN domain
MSTRTSAAVPPALFGREYVLLDRVWQVIATELVPLEERIRSILNELR